MPGLNSILNLARRALDAQQVGMSVTSHNIANASTLGYSRQRADFTTTPPEQMPYGYLGTGVMVSHIGRLRDAFVDRSIRGANDTYGFSTSQNTVLSQVEAMVNEPSDSFIGSLLGKFFSSFQDLSNHPEETSSRNAVVQSATLLSGQMNQLSANLRQLRSDMASDVQTKVTRINQLTDEISKLDIQIVDQTTRGTDPSDLKDERDLRIEELSKLANTYVSEDSNGSVMVSIGGTVVASRGGSVTLGMQMTAGNMSIIATGTGNTVNVNGGEIGGVIEAHNTRIPAYQTRLDDIAAALITRVNALHAAGFGLGTPPSTGTAFFTGTDASSIAVNAAVVSDPNLVAASGDGSSGSNTVALAIAGVELEKLLAGNSQTLGEHFAGMVSDIGSRINGTANTQSTQEFVLQQLETQRQSTSGVSLDEEMTNMIKYQRAFDAASKIVKTVDEMYQTVLSMKS
jgi:flagellar hook-associated protein 1